MRLRLLELQSGNLEAQNFRGSEFAAKGYEDIDGVLHYQGLLYVPQIIYLELISYHHDNLLAGYFRIDKTWELIAKKYYWPTFCPNIKAYVKGCDVCLASKAVCHKPYRDLQLLLIPTDCWKNLSINFIIGLPMSAN